MGGGEEELEGDGFGMRFVEKKSYLPPALEFCCG